MRKTVLRSELAVARGDRDRSLERVAELEVRSAQLEQALNGTPQAVFVVGASSEWVFDNSGAEQLLRPSHSAALVRPVVDALLARALAGAAAMETVRMHGPPPQVLSVSASPIRQRGVSLGALAVVEDVSQRHQLDAVRRDFIANVSHELRTPVGALQVLAETMAEEDSPSVLRRLAVRVGLEANRAGRLIADLLDLSRIEAEGLAEPTVVDLVVVLEKSVERVRESAQQRSITLAVDAGPARTRGNEAQLVSAVTNLLDNAVKYTERGGSVAASTARVDDHVVVRVADTGIGIPSRDLDRIFERFYRVDPGRSRETGGTGLGLAIVRHVARNHGGDVVVESTEGVGSSFTMKLLAHDAS